MRELPSLSTICVRALGAPSCSAEDTFSKLSSGDLSTASRMLRTFRNSDKLSHQACIGPGSSRRVNANDVDLNHPIIAYRQALTEEELSDGKTILDQPLLMQHGNPALDFLQSYIDTLVELGRMDDSRLGIHFFREWKANLNVPSSPDVQASRPTKKRKSSAGSSTVPMKNPVGALSLHNCAIGAETVTALVKAEVGPHLAVLDLTGIRGMTDDLMQQLADSAPNLERLSLKNCRKVTKASFQHLAKLQKLQCLDVGGCFNISTGDLLEMVPQISTLDELHASGFDWNDTSIRELVSHRASWKGLSLGFSSNFFQSSLREAFPSLSHTLETLALPFCEAVVDNALMGILGRNLPLLRALDVRGNASLTTLTGWYDGRVSAELELQAHLVVLARYTGVSASSVEETQRSHPRSNLTVVLDGGGTGAGVMRSTY